MIKIVDLHFRYNVRPILKGINLELADGELLALMGPNGMGKSTLLGTLGGSLWPHRGYHYSAIKSPQDYRASTDNPLQKGCLRKQREEKWRGTQWTSRN